MRRVASGSENTRPRAATIAGSSSGDYRAASTLIRAHQLALAADDGSLELCANAQWGMSSSLLPRAAGRSVRVDALTLDSFLAREANVIAQPARA
jgi:hypothetical protein